MVIPEDAPGTVSSILLGVADAESGSERASVTAVLGFTLSSSVIEHSGAEVTGAELIMVDGAEGVISGKLDGVALETVSDPGAQCPAAKSGIRATTTMAVTVPVLGRVLGLESAIACIVPSV
jgi:hypothetical protein